MTPAAQTLTDILTWGTLLLHILFVVLIVLLVREYATRQTHGLLSLFRTYTLKLSFLLALGGSVMTLVYSEIFGFMPCGLCWLQRVFLYPQVFLLGVALWKSDKGIPDYLIALSVPGFLIAMYQHFIQMGGNSFLPCPAAAGAADCAQRIIFEFGYITFPLMSATAFAALILLSIILRRR